MTKILKSDQRWKGKKGNTKNKCMNCSSIYQEIVKEQTEVWRNQGKAASDASFWKIQWISWHKLQDNEEESVKSEKLHLLYLFALHGLVCSPTSGQLKR